MVKISAAIRASSSSMLVALTAGVQLVQAFTTLPSTIASIGGDRSTTRLTRCFASPKTKNKNRNNNNNNNNNENDAPLAFWNNPKVASKVYGLGLAATLFASTLLGPAGAAFGATESKTYDGFADYAKENQMEQSDVGCFINKCGDQTKALFSNPRGIKGVSCLGRCKGEQSCATRCFAEFGSDSLNEWLSCTIEEHECVKVPKNSLDNTAENVGYTTVVKNFDPSSLVGTWYKTDGLNPNYDLFDCQTNTFAKTSANELDMGIFFRVRRPVEVGGGYWENSLTEHMVVDTAATATKKKSSSSSSSSISGAVNVANAAATDGAAADNGELNPAGRTMHTGGKMYGLAFTENWYILGESDGMGNIPPFKLVAYKGHTLQGNYEGAFVYAKERVLPESAIPAVRQAAAQAGLDFVQFTRIDNTCPVSEQGNRLLNDATAGTGTSTTDWVDLVIGEGGVIDWISPGWRGEYKKS